MNLDTGDSEFYPSDYLLEYTSDYIPDLYNLPIKSIDDDELDQLLEFFHSTRRSSDLIQHYPGRWNEDNAGLDRKSVV